MAKARMMPEDGAHASLCAPYEARLSGDSSNSTRPPSMNKDASFAARLRRWRQRRGLSQLALSHAANVSQRHVSFLEIGRTAPSREMVLRLSAALELTFREQNALLLAAGFAPLWRETAFGAPGLTLVHRALDFMLDQQEPYPGYVLDRRWNLLRANRA